MLCEFGTRPGSQDTALLLSLSPAALSSGQFKPGHNVELHHIRRRAATVSGALYALGRPKRGHPHLHRVAWDSGCEFLQKKPRRSGQRGAASIGRSLMVFSPGVHRSFSILC